MSLNKPLDEIREDDLQILVDDKVAEKKTIEYKGAALPGNTDSEKKEFLADVSSFANAAGGHLIYGIKEDNGLPIEVCGIEIDDVDAAILRLDSLMRNGISPRLPGPPPIQAVPLPSRPPHHYALIIRIQRSWIQPHRVILQDHGHFYSRNSAGKYRLDVSELRTAFESSATTAERIRNFRIERISRIVAGETPAKLDEKAPKLILHMVPFSALTLDSQVDLNLLTYPNDRISIKPLISKPAAGPAPSYNFDGILAYRKLQDLDNLPCSYVQVFRNGSIETVDTSILSYSGARKEIPGAAFNKKVRETIAGYLAILKHLDVEPPVALMVSLIGVKGFQIEFISAEEPQFDYKIDRADLIVPETIIDNLDSNIAQAIKPALDTIWNAAGWRESMA